MQPERRHHFIRFLVLFALVVGLLLAFIFGLSRVLQQKRPGFVVPDEKKAAFELLAQKFAGPSYFRSVPSHPTGPSQDKTGEPRITAADARSQVKRIVEERNLGTDGATNLNSLIDLLTEPSPSRVVGEPAVNLLRLNLALDALPARQGR